MLIKKTTKITISGLLVFLTSLIVACQPRPNDINTDAVPTIPTLFEASQTAVPLLSSPQPSPTRVTVTPARQQTAGATITVDVTGVPITVNSPLLGTNLPAWLTSDTLENSTFQARALAAGISLIRIPGGSWSNYYDWLACERDTVGIDEAAECYWPWAATPTDFLNFLRDTGLNGMYIVNLNGTAKEAAALVAFFNGTVDADTVIGIDVRGRDWGRVSDWAQLRSNNGNPEPIGIQYWEVGNEVYGGTADSGTDCTAFGWEEVWTCDGTEYVNGLGSGPNRKEGYLEFRDAMRAVDPTILVGAVGIPYQSDWSNWGNEVIAAAGDVMDFYIIHQYGFFDPPATYAEALAEPHTTWPAIAADLHAAFKQYAGGREVPIAVTEYNLFSVQDQDNGQLMTRLVNALYMADTVGQMIVNGVQIANQWDLANGQANNGTDYGLVHALTYERYPQYYVYTLWSRFGSQMLPVTNALPADTVLTVYAGWVEEDTLSILAINKTGEAVDASILLENSAAITGGFVDVLAADSLNDQTITFNGQNNPATDFSDAPSMPLTVNDNPFAYTFLPYSITLLRLDLERDR